MARLLDVLGPALRAMGGSSHVRAPREERPPAAPPVPAVVPDVPATSGEVAPPVAVASAGGAVAAFAEDDFGGPPRPRRKKADPPPADEAIPAAPGTSPAADSDLAVFGRMARIVEVVPVLAERGIASEDEVVAFCTGLQQQGIGGAIGRAQPIEKLRQRVRTALASRTP